MDEIFGTQSGDTQMDLLINSYKQTQKPRIDALTQKRTLLQSRQNFYSTFRSRIDNLASTIDKFKVANAINNFNAKSVSSSDSSTVSATATGSAILGVNSVKVNQLASNDLLISNRVNLTASFGEDAGTSTFDIQIGQTTKQVSVTFDGTETNESAMKKIVSAINKTTDIGVNASFVKDTSTTGRITLTSQKTGSENQIIFTQNSALDKLGLNPVTLSVNSTTRITSTNSNAGYRKSDFNSLDSSFELNGINITRSTNSVSDVLDGVTLNLLKVQKVEDNPIELKTSVNSSSVESFVKGLLTSMNDVVSNLNSNKDIKKSDSFLSGIVQSIKNVAVSKFSNGENGAPQYLSDIGIKFDNSGFLVISDSSLFSKVLQNNVEDLANMFIGENGIAKQIEKIIEPVRGSGGTISQRSSSLKSQIDIANKRITDAEQRIEVQTVSLKKQYQSYLKLLYQAQNQNNFLNGFTTTTQ